MHKQYEYKSVFALFINDYMLSHRKAGFEFDNPAYWLYRFDRYCVAHKVDEYVLDKHYLKKMVQIHIMGKKGMCSLSGFIMDENQGA